MTEKKLSNRVRKIREIDEQIAELQKRRTAVVDEIKADMTAANLEEIKTPSFVIRFKTIVSNQFDRTAFKRDMPELFAQYSKPSTTRRFTIA